MKVAMIGWEFPPFMAGGLGIHCLEITKGLAAQGVSIDFYMPRMALADGGLPLAERHDHLRITEVEAESGLSPYGAPAATEASLAARRQDASSNNESHGLPLPATPNAAPGRYEADFNNAAARYNRRVVQSFDSYDADVLHAHDWITVPAALQLQRMTGKPLVLTMHSMEVDRSAGFYPQGWIADIERRGVRQADRVIAVSRYTKKALVTEYGVAAAKVTAVHNGIDTAKFHDPATRDYHAAARPVLFLSRLSRQKGPLHFLAAARRVLQARPDARFVMAGTGEMMGPCLQYTLDHGIADRVTFTGFVANDELAHVYASNGMYVLPSVSEPFGISVLEAMASGLPTLVSRSCGVGEALTHVLRAAYDDADDLAGLIIAVLDNPQLGEEMGRNGAREAARFTWHDCASRTLGVYRDAVAATKTKALARDAILGTGPALVAAA